MINSGLKKVGKNHWKRRGKESRFSQEKWHQLCGHLRHFVTDINGKDSEDDSGDDYEDEFDARDKTDNIFLPVWLHA